MGRKIGEKNQKLIEERSWVGLGKYIWGERVRAFECR